MKAFVWRVVYALVGFFVFWLLFPPFVAAVGLQLGALMPLLRVATGCIALLYVLYPSNPPTPF